MTSPAAALQTSVVQVLPSLQDVASPPPVHWPAAQVLPAAHAWPQAPQLVALDPRSTQVDPHRV